MTETKKDIKVITGKTNPNILIIAPHGVKGDDDNTGKLARAIRKRLDCNAIINEVFKKPEKDKNGNYGEANTKDYLANLNFIPHAQAYSTFIDKIKANISDPSNTHVFWIHGIDDDNIPDEAKKLEASNLKCLVGYGQGNGNGNSMDEKMAKDFIKFLNENNLSTMATHAQSEDYRGASTNNMNQYFNITGGDLAGVQSVQLEFAYKEVRKGKHIAETAEKVAEAISATLVMKPIVMEEAVPETQPVEPTASDTNATEDTVPTDASVPVQVIEPEIVQDDEDPVVEQTTSNKTDTENTVLTVVPVLLQKKEAEKDPVDDQLVENAFEYLKNIFSTHFHEAMLAAGKYLIEEFYGGYEQAIKKKPTKAGSLRQLIDRLQKSDGQTPSKTWIYDAVKLASDEHRLSGFPTYGNIGHSHKVLLTHVKNIERKKELVNETAKNKYTVAHLRGLIKKGNPNRRLLITADKVPANIILEQQDRNKLEDLRAEIDQGISFYEKKLDQYETNKVRVDEVIKQKPKDNKTLPKVGFRDWTSRDFNIQQGCLNNCLYCYAKADTYRRQQGALDSWEDQTIRRHDVEKLHKLYPGLVGFPSTHDITPENLDDYLYVLGKLLRAGNEVLIVSKPRLDCIKAICAASLFFKDEILFRFTIGAMNNDILGFWEPNAPGYEERRACLEFAFNQGFRTSVSMEPMLDKPRIDKQIADLRKYVKVKEHIWLGTMSHLTAMKKDADEDLLSKIVEVEAGQTMERLIPIYQKYKDDPQIKWKTEVLEKIEAHLQQNGEAAK